MRLIKKIEINYLRSLYSATLADIGDLNILFGKNDSGKSNVLRALNLFFNDEIEADRCFDFELDLSDLRKQEAREAKGKQFLWMRITFNVGKNYRKSLGTEFSVKRQWNRDGDLSTTFFLQKGREGHQARASRYLNSIGFTYIPAIKDLEVYADLIERVYGAASQTAKLIEATSAFIGVIDQQTSTLSHQLTSLFGSHTTLSPPTEMQRLFRSLDFAHGEERHSLLRQKGDGIKARHIPELLRFINQNESKTRLHLWGFEEPENSLDLAAAEAEASRFSEFSARDDTQIFVTSHSPAFYLADADEQVKVKRYFITKQKRDIEKYILPKNATTKIDTLEQAEEHMQDAGLLQLPFVIRNLKYHKEIISQNKIIIDSLKTELSELSRPTLFVEGKHDVRLFSSVFKEIPRGQNIHVAELGGTPSNDTSLLKSVLQQGGLSAKKPTLFLFDNDVSGRKSYRAFIKKSINYGLREFREGMHVWVLDTTDEFKQFSKRYNIPDEKILFTAEMLFPVNDAAKICGELMFGSHDNKNNSVIPIHETYFQSLPQQTVLKLMSAEFGTVDWFYSRGVPNNQKEKFALLADERGFSRETIKSTARVILDTLID